MRLSWWNGFTFGAMERKVDAARKEAFAAMVRFCHEHRREDWGT